MTITRGATPKQLIPGLNAVLGLSYGKIDGEHAALFDEYKSDRSFEIETMMSGLGDPFVKQEGAAVLYDDMQETFSATYIHQTVALAFAITEEAMEDNLYESKSRMRAESLGRSMANFKQQTAADVFNLGFSTTQLGGDGVVLFSTAHPTVAGNQSNLETAADIAETTLETALINAALTKDERGILIGANVKSLHIPVNLRFAAFRILKADRSTTLGGSSATNVNDPNAIKQLGMFPGGMHINHRFVDQDAWFLRLDIPNGTKYFVRAPLATSNEGDFDTGNMRFKARERYSFGWSDWRQYRGNAGT